MDKLPTFWTWYTDKYDSQAQRFISRCEELKIPAIAEQLPIEKYSDSLGYVRNSLSQKRFIFKCGLLFLRDRFLSFRKPLFYIHSDSKILIKPEKEIFDNIDIGYCISEKEKSQQIIASHGIFLNYCKLSKDFLNLLTYKCKTIRAERPTEHGIIRTSIFDFTGYLPDDKLIKNGSQQKFKGKFNFRKNIKPLVGQKKKYLLSKTDNTYIKWR